MTSVSRNSLRRARPLLGTFVEIAAAGVDPAVMHEAVDAAFAAVAEIEWLMSFHAPDSDVSRLNLHAARHAVAVHPWTTAVLAAALDLRHRSAGCFDIAVASTLQALGVLPGTPAAESGKGDAIELIPDGRVRFWDAALRIDLGGIAKGFAVDRALEALAERGMHSGVVNAGGDLAVFGHGPHSVHLRDTRHPGAALCRIDLRNEALATSCGFSGNTAMPGRSPAALIDPGRHLPVAAIIGASVLAPSCMLADGLTKVVMVDPERAAPVLRHYGASALVVEAEGGFRCTGDWRKSVGRAS